MIWGPVTSVVVFKRDTKKVFLQLRAQKDSKGLKDLKELLRNFKELFGNSKEL